MKTLKTIGIYAISGICALISFSFILKLNPLGQITDIYLYKSYIYSCLTAMILLIALITIKRIVKMNRILDGTTIISSVIISLLGLMLFSSVVTMPLDRSYTIFSLADMYENSEKVYSEQDIERQFIDIYIHKLGATKTRISEQVSIGNMEIVEGGYKLTDKGKSLIEMYRLIEKFYPVDNKDSIYPNY